MPDHDDDGAEITYPRDATLFPVRAENLEPLPGIPMAPLNVVNLEHALRVHGVEAVLLRWDVPADRLPKET